MKLFIRPLGIISSRFAGNEPWREFSHTGIDFRQGFKKPISAVADGVIYKVTGKGNPDLMVYRNVYQITETPLGPMEIAYVHCWDILVSSGDVVFGGQPIATEGNTGTLVFSGGVKVTAEQKPSGKGSHLHLSVRPLQRTKTSPAGHYINDASGKRFKDTNGNYYRIEHEDNGTKGWVNLEDWLYTPTTEQLKSQYVKIIAYLRGLLLDK